MKRTIILLTVLILTLTMFSQAFSMELIENNVYPVSSCTLEGDSYILGTNVNNLDGDHLNSSVTYNISVPSKGIYSLRFFYFTPVDATLTMYIDNVKTEKIQFTPTTEGSWDKSVLNVHKYIELESGNHTIKLTRESDDTNYVAIGSLTIAALNDTVYKALSSEATLIGDAVLLGSNINTLDKDHVGSGATYSFKGIKAGKYIARLYYFTSAETATHSLFVEDIKVGTLNYIACNQGGWDSFSYECFTEVEVTLKEGDNNITVKVTEEDSNFAAISNLYLISTDKSESETYEVINNKTELNLSKHGKYNIRLFYSSATEGKSDLMLSDSKIGEVTYENTNSNYTELLVELPSGKSILNIEPKEAEFKYAVISLVEEITEPVTETNPETSDSCIIYITLIVLLMAVILKKKQEGVKC